MNIRYIINFIVNSFYTITSLSLQKKSDSSVIDNKKMLKVNIMEQGLKRVLILI